MVEDKSSTMIFKFYVNIEFWFITYHHFCAYGLPIYWLFGRWQVYCPLRKQLFPLAKWREIVAVKGDNKLAVVRIVS